MPNNWFFPARRERNAHVEACIAHCLDEARLSSQTVSLFQAAFRLQSRARAGGVVLGFDQALYRLKRRDRMGVFVRGK
jgi:hypothetical protein